MGIKIIGTQRTRKVELGKSRFPATTTGGQGFIHLADYILEGLLVIAFIRLTTLIRPRIRLFLFHPISD